MIINKGQRIRPWIVEEAEKQGVVGSAGTMYEGLDIVEYWKGIQSAVYDEAAYTVPTDVDFSEWYETQACRFGWDGQGGKSKFYYVALMALYASGRAVLLDTPPTAFAEKVMTPAYEKVKNELGVTALITCELSPEKRDWTDLSFVDDVQATALVETGRIEI